MSWDVPLQMRLDFAEEAPRVDVGLVLAGWTVLCDIDADSEDQWGKALLQVGVSLQHDDVRGITFPVHQLPLLADLPEQIRVSGDESLHPLLQLLRDPPPDTAPALLTVVGGEFTLSWRSRSGTAHEYDLRTSVATRLPVLGVTFLASSGAWARLAEEGVHTGVIATARLTHEGYVELSTAVPQLVESAPLPGLFRLDATHFGVAACYAGALQTIPGFAWSGPRDHYDDMPLAPLPFDVSAHTHADLSDLTQRLRVSGSVLLAWESGLGRRIAALAAVRSLDALPALVVCPDHAVWLWQRHADIAGCSVSLVHDDADMRIVTFDDLVRGAALPSAAAVIVDGVDRITASHPQVGAALHHLDGLTGIYRLGLAAQWPQEPSRQVAMLETIRPGEFTTAMSLDERYPVDARRRLGEHADAYVLRRTREDVADLPGFARSRVIDLEQPEEMERAATDAARRRCGDLPGLREELLDMAAAGPVTQLSPKIAAAVDLLRASASAGRAVTVLTRSPRAAVLMSALAHPHQVSVVDDHQEVPADGPSICLTGPGLRDVRHVQDVVFMDYPWSMRAIDDAVGRSDDQGPHTVTVLHLSGSLDDRLALVAARRRDREGDDPTRPPEGEDLALLLAPWLARVAPDRSVVSGHSCVVCGELLVRGATGWHCPECGSAPAPLLRMPR